MNAIRFAVIGSVEEEAAWQGNRQTSNAVVESFIDKGDKRIRTLVTPNIIRTNEPNEVRVDLFKGKFIPISNWIGNERIFYYLQTDDSELQLMMQPQ